MKSHLLLAMIGTFAVIVGAQTQEGFISLNCGLPVDESPYDDLFTGVTFTSDSTFIQTGKTSRVDKSLNKILARQYLTLRYFPEGKRNCSLRLSFRTYLKSSAGYIRYADDVRDRIWYPYINPSYTYITTNLDINNSNAYEIPKTALRSAATPKNASEPLIISWLSKYSNPQVYLYMHFAEIQALEANETREFDVILKNFNYSSFSPTKLKVSTLFTEVPMQCYSGICSINLVKTPKSTLPPLINAFEAYTVKEFSQLETSLSDVDAIKNIKVTYRLSEISWQGDPCLPQDLAWKNLRCTYIDTATPPRIIFLNLPESGLTGRIAPSIQNLTQLQELDLSNNNLTGPVPSFLASMKSLSLINLSGNNLNGSVPQALLDRVKEGLVLKLEGNPDLCKSSLCNPKEKKNFLFPAIASAASLLVIVMVVALIFVFRKKKVPSDVPAPPGMPVADVGHTSHSESSFLSKKIRFTYIEVQQMTNKFERALGEGGFGVVYHGCVNGTQQVAVKVLSQSSSQGYKHFKAEVELLMRVHHINLVSLIGYCDEGDHLALIYEYMPNGDLKQHLSGERGVFVLSWENRLRITVDAALGLEYLHTGCIPPIVHRGIKTTNILLDQNFQAKLADFGLSRSFPTGNETYVSTVVAGTPGYLDPEYYQTNWLTEKSDIYSFGIVLLEIITNQPIIQQFRENPHLVEWISHMIRKGDIRNIMDPNLHQNYDIGSVWKAIEVAMSCVSPSSAGRPTMSRVATDLKECLISEISSVRENLDMESKSSINYSMDLYTEVIPKAR
ncbi:probable leucine-rich repeat receptor-like protein kinase At2g28990 isoform X2 [Eutrema salsugineum]|uniref:probable leucine-rich repeat receptor-like protein kinase At2g28990 isoform X2 n=1 Tax=Eutrema salsugineum TaxID=72664 RepID=UPI000CED34A7|nr:probable leucine-rich repeat receptor-like protein kinase At2g28990 isoform X2 [Eutrema salsugineum]